MAFLLLPSLSANSNVAIPKSGEWTTSSQNTLSDLVNGLKVAANKHSNISSIPDVWARPILVRSILGDPTHPQYERYVAEWRGLLAIMALRKIRGFNNLHLNTIEIPTTDKLRDDDPEFLKVLARSVPLEYLELQNDGTIKDKPGIQAKIQLLSYDNHPLGIFWPSVLICPALGLDTYRPQEIAWWGNDGIMDPIGSLSKEEKNSLYAWIQHVINSVNNNNDLMGLLSSFRDDIKASLGDAFADTAFQAPAGLSMGVTGACAILDQPITGVIDDTFLEKSQVLLMNQRENKDLTNLLIVTPDLDKQWNMSESEIIIGGYINASTCLHKGTGRIHNHTRLGEIDLTEYNAAIYMADEFFTDKIAVCYFPYNAFPTTLENKVYSYGTANVNIILPIRKWLLEYLEPEFIAQHTHIAVIDRDIEVTLELPVSGSTPEGTLLTAKKRYRAVLDNNVSNNTKKEILEYDSIPLIQVWPNIRMREPHRWNRYYTYADSGNNAIVFNTTPIFPDGNCAKVKLPGTAAEICKGTSFPEAFVCEHVTKDLYGTEVPEEIGLLLLNQRKVETINTQNSTCKIGIDFGTTNTTAYMRVDNERPQPIQFKKHKYYVTLTQDAENLTGDDRNLLRQNFISEQEQPSDPKYPIKTMYHANPEWPTADPFFSGNIYYMEHSGDVDVDKTIMGNIKTTELKWNQVKGRLYMQGFLMQLCLQCMVEAVVMGASTLEWLYSYPKAFSIMQQSQYQSTWNSLYEETIQQACTLSSTKPTSLSESESVAEYFKKDMQASTTRGILCMDIGGGTTDIAVWQDTTNNEEPLLNQTSIRFAGRNILNDYLWSRKQTGQAILTKLKSDGGDFTKMLTSMEQEISQHSFDLKLEALLRYYGDDIFKSLHIKSADPEIKLFMRDISFALSGIFFYSGMVIGYLRKKEKYDQKQLLPNCYIGGNASKLLNWAADGTFSNESVIASVFKNCMYAGITAEDPDEILKKKFDINITGQPKQEVAYGLVTSQGSSDSGFDFGLDDDDDDGAVLFAGEKFIVDTESRESDLVTASDFLEGLHIDNEKPEVFEQFLSLFNRLMRKIGWDPIAFSDDDFINICTNVNQVLSDMRKEAGGDVENVNAEPIFILVLKEAYRYLANHK